MKISLIIGALLLCCSAVFSQEKLSDEKRKEFEAQKIAFFTQELDLSPEEAVLFWPLYTEMQKKIWELELARRKDYRAIKKAVSMKEEDYLQAVEKNLEYDTKILETKKEYFKKMCAVISPSKIWRLGDAEHKFHRQLFAKLRPPVAPKK